MGAGWPTPPSLITLNNAKAVFQSNINWHVRYLLSHSKPPPPAARHTGMLSYRPAEVRWWRKVRTFHRISCGGYLTTKTEPYEDQYPLWSFKTQGFSPTPGGIYWRTISPLSLIPYLWSWRWASETVSREFQRDESSVPKLDIDRFKYLTCPLKNTAAMKVSVLFVKLIIITLQKGN